MSCVADMGTTRRAKAPSRQTRRHTYGYIEIGVSRSDRAARPDRLTPILRGFGPAVGQPRAEAASVNRSGVSGAVTGCATLRPSPRDLRGLPASSTPIDLEGHERVRPACHCE